MAEAGVGLAASQCTADEEVEDDFGVRVAYRAKPPRTAAADDARAILLVGSFAEDAKNSDDALLLEDDACRTSRRHGVDVSGRRAARRSERASMMGTCDRGAC